MAVFGRLRMPSLGGATGWLNSEPLGPAELQGGVVLLVSKRQVTLAGAGAQGRPVR